MTIHVTQAHIDAGARNSCIRCPIALAVEDAGVRQPVVSCRRIRSVFGGPEWVTPDLVVRFVCDFDRGDPVVPFSFELDVTP